METSIDEGDLAFAFADIRSGSPDLLLRGLRSLSFMAQRDLSENGHMARLLGKEGLISDLLDVMRSHTMSRDVSLEVSWIFRNLAAPTSGCHILLEFDVPRQLLDIFDVATMSLCSNKALENALWIVAHIACMIANGVARLLLMDSNIYDKCLQVLARVAEHPKGVRTKFVHIVAALFDDILGNKRQLSFSFAEPALPHITSLLHKLDPHGDDDALWRLANCCASIFAETVEGVDWSVLRSTGLLARLFTVTRLGVAVDPVVKLLSNAAAHDDHVVTELVLSDDALDWLVTVAALPTPSDRRQSKLFRLLSNVAAHSRRLRDNFGQLDLFGPLLTQLAARMRTERFYDSYSAWSAMYEASCMMHNILSGPHAEAVDQALLRAGALEFAAAALANRGAYHCERADELVSRLVSCVGLLIRAGSTERDEAYIEHGGPPSNEYLAAFCAAGAGGALMTALDRREAPADAVVDMFNSLIGPIVGADGDVTAENTPAAYLALLDLSTARPVGEPLVRGLQLDVIALREAIAVQRRYVEALSEQLFRDVAWWRSVQLVEGVRAVRATARVRAAPSSCHYAEVTKQEHLAAIVVELRKLTDRVNARKAEQEYQQRLEAGFRDDSESVNAMVVYWSMCQIIVVVLSTVYQVYKLRSFFTANKINEAGRWRARGNRNAAGSAPDPRDGR